MRQLKYLLVALMLLPFAAFARNAPIHDADVAVVGDLSAKQVGEAVVRTLTGRRWIFTPPKGNSLEATQMTRGLMAKITVSWDAQHVTIKYLDSQGLDYADNNGERTIHGNYNKWIGNLERDLPVFMTRVAAGQ